MAKTSGLRSDAARAADPDELLRRADAFEEGEDDRGLVVLHEPGGDVHRVEPRFVPRGHHVAEVERLGPSAVEEGEADAAALRDHRDPASAAPLGPEPVLDVHHGRAERRRERHPVVQEALGVGAEDRHVELPRDVGDLALARRPGLAPLLAEPGADDDRGPHPLPPARPKRGGDVLGRNGDDGEVHRPRQRVHRGMARDAGDLVVAPAHRVERAVEPVQGHRLHDAPADDRAVRRRADEGDRTRPEQGIQVGQGQTSCAGVSGE